MLFKFMSPEKRRASLEAKLYDINRQLAELREQCAAHNAALARSGDVSSWVAKNLEIQDKLTVLQAEKVDIEGRLMS